MPKIKSRAQSTSGNYETRLAVAQSLNRGDRVRHRVTGKLGAFQEINLGYALPEVWVQFDSDSEIVVPTSCNPLDLELVSSESNQHSSMPLVFKSESFDAETISVPAVEVLEELTQEEVSNYYRFESGHREPKLLKPHSHNCLIYGENEDVSELIQLIDQSGWIKPLVITSNNIIISGHRRWKAALELKLASVPVEVRQFPDELAELEALLLENASRFKTIEQKVREAEAWKDIEAAKARKRQIALAGSRPNLAKATNLQPNLAEGHKATNLQPNLAEGHKATNLQPNLAEGHEKGQTRDKVAARVGLKRTTYEKAAKVVQAIDTEINQGSVERATAFRQILNEQSVDAAYELLKKPSEERDQILNLIGATKARNTREARAHIQRMPSAVEFVKQTSPSKYKVGDLIRIQCQAFALQEQKAWNGCWGRVQSTGNISNVKVLVANKEVDYMAGDLDWDINSEPQFRDACVRVLNLWQQMDLEPVEENLLIFFQRRPFFTELEEQMISLMEAKRTSSLTNKQIN